jgi:type VI secretion system protein ImpC
MAESMQHKLARVHRHKPACIHRTGVHITCDIQNGSIELPFVVGVLVDLSGHPDPAEPSPKLPDPKRRFVEVNQDNFDAVMQRMKPRLYVKIDNKLTDDGTTMTVELRFYRVKDFEPEHIVEQIEPLRKLLETRRQLAVLLAMMSVSDQLDEGLQAIISKPELLQQVSKDAKEAGLVLPGGAGAQEQAQAQEPTEAQADVSLLDKLIDKSGIVLSEESRQASRQCITRLVEEVMQGNLTISKDTLKASVEALDAVLSRQLNEIIHHDDFQRLEASWRGLHYLVHNSETSEILKIRVLNLSKDDLCQDFEEASDVDQSALFQKVYETEYGMLGGEPYGVLHR